MVQRLGVGDKVNIIRREVGQGVLGDQVRETGEGNCQGKNYKVR